MTHSTCIFAFLLLCVMSQTDASYAQDRPCTDGDITSLESRFNREADFKGIVGSLKLCFYQDKDSTAYNINTRAERLWALSHYYLAAEGETEKLDEYYASLETLLNINSEYTPPDSDPPFFRIDIISLRQSRLRKAKNRRNLAIIGGIAGGAAGVVAMIVFLNRDPEVITAPPLDPLPDPPGDPSFAW